MAQLCYPLQMPNLKSEITADSTAAQVSEEVIAAVKGCRKRPDCLATLRLFYDEHLAEVGGPKEKVYKTYIHSMTTPIRKPNSNKGLFAPETAGASISIKEGGVSHPALSGEEEFFRINELMGQLLHKPDPDALTILMGAAVSHFLPVDPVWMFFVSPASGGKNEHIETLRRLPQSKLLDNLTSKTLMSGLSLQDAHNGVEPSLLLRYHDAIFLNPDLSPMLNLHHDERAQIFSQLLRVYDGEYEPEVGTGKPLHWKGRITFLTGITPIIYAHYRTLATLGPRFLMLRLHQSEAQSQARWAIRRGADTRAIRDELQFRMAHYIEQLDKSALPTMTPTDEEWLASLGNLVSHARSVVNHDDDGDPEDVPGRELPGRITNELKSLMMGLGVGLAHPAITSEERRLVRRVGFDTIPPLRYHILMRLFQTPNIGVAAIRAGSDSSDAKARRGIEDLEWLGLVEGKGLSGGETYCLTPPTQQLMSHILG